MPKGTQPKVVEHDVARDWGGRNPNRARFTCNTQDCPHKRTLLIPADMHDGPEYQKLIAAYFELHPNTTVKRQRYL